MVVLFLKRVQNFNQKLSDNQAPALTKRGMSKMSKIESSKCAPRIPRFILQVSFTDTLLVVSILDAV